MLENKKGRLICVLAAAVAVLVTGILLILNTKAQQAKKAELEAERQKQQEKLEQLKLECESKEELIEYVKSDEFLLRYARENWGYLPEGDIRFDVNNPDLPKPAAVNDADETAAPETSEAPATAGE